MRSVMKRLAASVAVVAVSGWLATYAPLHAQAQKPGGAPVAAKVRSAIEEHIARDTKLKGGFFVRDAKDQRVRDLALDYVHSGLEPGPGGQQVMCVDFLDRNKDRLDIDFYVKATPSGELQVADIKIHKVNGAERK